MNKQLDINQALDLLELGMDVFYPVTHSPSPQIAVQELEKFKELVTKQWKKLAKKFHPDICKDIDGEEKMKEINNIVDILKKLQIQVRRPPVQVIQVYNFGGGFYNDSTSTSSTYTSTTSW